jgi:uncharacterized membrane protein
VTTLVAIGAAPCNAGDATLTVLPVTRAVDVTIDEFGRTLVLMADDFHGFGQMYLYETGSSTYIGDGLAWALSSDGLWVSGKSFASDSRGIAARWLIGGTTEELGWLPGTGETCGSLSSGYECSADGSVVVGLSWDGCSGRAFRWTPETDMVAMEMLGTGGNRASVVSDDGQVLAGFANTEGPPSRSPAVWNADGTGWLLNETAFGEIMAITPDGTTVAGTYGDEDDVIPPFYQATPAFYWNEDEGLVRIGWLDDDKTAMAQGISADGDTIVGFSGHILETGLDAFVWTRQRGMEKLYDRLVQLGVPGLEDVVLASANDVSQDGRTVVGWGYFPDAEEGIVQRGWIATLPEPEPIECPEDLDGDGAVGFTDLTQLLGSWGPCPACPEDLDGDGIVGFTDLTQLLGSWGPCV